MVDKQAERVSCKFCKAPHEISIKRAKQIGKIHVLAKLLMAALLMFAVYGAGAAQEDCPLVVAAFSVNLPYVGDTDIRDFISKGRVGNMMDTRGDFWATAVEPVVSYSVSSGKISYELASFDAGFLWNADTKYAGFIFGPAVRLDNILKIAAGRPSLTLVEGFPAFQVQAAAALVKTANEKMEARFGANIAFGFGGN
jgi:hypothetical protein